jgi:hypothetical protein
MNRHGIFIYTSNARYEIQPDGWVYGYEHSEYDWDNCCWMPSRQSAIVSPSGIKPWE